ncbi:MAG: penicillin-binding protein activator LpoB [Planctomycetota bacterium]
MQSEEQKMKKTLFLLITLALLLSGCGDGSYNRGAYVDPDEPSPVGDYYSDTDLKLAAEAMFNSLVTTPCISDAVKPPVLIVMMMENRSRDRVDMEDLTNKLSTALIRTGKVLFVNKRLRSGLVEEYEYNQSGMVDPSTAKAPGGQVAADYVLSGELTGIEMPRGNEKRVYYRLTIRLTDIRTNLVVWQDEKEIKKLLKK